MALLTHAAVGLAAKAVAPRAPLGLLWLGAFAIDLIGGLVNLVAKLERFPKAGETTLVPWSHGLFMSTVWSAAAGAATGVVRRDPRAGVFAGLLVFSHWAVDFISWPMTYVRPSDTGLPLLFGGSRTVGLGLYRSLRGVLAGELGSLVLGLAIYLMAVRRGR